MGCTPGPLPAAESAYQSGGGVCSQFDVGRGSSFLGLLLLVPKRVWAADSPGLLGGSFRAHPAPPFQRSWGSLGYLSPDAPVGALAASPVQGEGVSPRAQRRGGAGSWDARSPGERGGGGQRSGALGPARLCPLPQPPLGSRRGGGQPQSDAAPGAGLAGKAKGRKCALGLASPLPKAHPHHLAHPSLPRPTCLPGSPVPPSPVPQAYLRRGAEDGATSSAADGGRSTSRLCRPRALSRPLGPSLSPPPHFLCGPAGGGSAPAPPGGRPGGQGAR